MAKSAIYTGTGTTTSNGMAERKASDASEWERLLKFASSNAANMDTGTMLGYGLGRLLRGAWDHRKEAKEAEKKAIAAGYIDGSDAAATGTTGTTGATETPTGGQNLMAQLVAENAAQGMGDISRATGYTPYDGSSVLDGYVYGQLHPGFFGTTASSTENSATDADGNTVSSKSDSVTPFANSAEGAANALDVAAQLAGGNDFGVGSLSDALANTYGLTGQNLGLTDKDIAKLVSGWR